jgi:hypothetical protein
MNRMNSIKMALETFDYVIEQLFLFSGLFLLFAGAVELLILILSPTKDQVFQFEMAFIYSYMIALGAFLVMYHKRILVKGYQT